MCLNIQTAHSSISTQNPKASSQSIYGTSTPDWYKLKLSVSLESLDAVVLTIHWIYE